MKYKSTLRTMLAYERIHKKDQVDKISKIMFFLGAIVAGVFLWMIIFGMSLGHAQDNETAQPRLASNVLIENGKWPTQLVVDTVTGCYGGTIQWIVLANPTLMDKSPPPNVQRMMLIHCSCILDKIRLQYTFVEYFKLFANPSVQGQFSDFIMKKAVECVRDHQTLEGLIKPDDLPNNQTTIKPEEPKDTKEEDPLPKQPTEEPRDEEPNTLFQG